MSFFSFTSSKDDCFTVTPNKTGKDKLYGELYYQARCDLRLMFIYTKIEQAAESGDWNLLNKLYNEFRLTQASRN